MIKEFLTKNIKTLLMSCLIAPALTAQAQFVSAPAFPGAEGFGRYTTGGRGGKVIHVTNLNDSGTGSLREAVKATGKRIIVFDVAGTIALSSDLKIENDNCTILGQTAPGGGICLKNYTLHINANNVIVRFIRCRMGDEAKNENDALSASHGTGSEKHHIIIDHCSVSWCVDECGSFYGNEYFTLQWCILSESLRNSVHGKGNHGYGGIWGGSRAAFHHNLLAHHDSRNPRFDHGYVSTLGGVVDYINNVVYNWGGNSTYGGENKPGCEPKVFNMVNNYYKPGPRTINDSKIPNRLLNPTTRCSNCNSTDQYNVVPGKFYINGNIVNGNTVSLTTSSSSSSNVNFDSGYDFSKFKTNCVINSRLLSTDNDFGRYNTISLHAASAAYNAVVDYAGASFSRDAVDTRIAQEVKNGTFTYGGSNGSTNGLIDTQTDVGGWPALTGTRETDSDNDGIPDAWEAAHGLSIYVDNSATYTLDRYGFYTDLEVYANYLVEDITKAERAGASATFAEYYPLDANPVSPISTTQAQMPNIEVSNAGRIEIKSIESNATIYYTKDGSTPTTSSIRYEGPFTVSNPCTIKAIAVVTGKNVSYENSRLVTITTPEGVYKVDPADAEASNRIVSVDGITMTYGACTDWTSGSANITVGDITFPYYAAASNSSGTNATNLASNPQTNRSYWVFTPESSGTLTLVVANIATDKSPVVVEDGTIIGATLIDQDGKSLLTSTTLTAGGTVPSTASWNGGIQIPVKAGSTYTYSLNGSKGRLCGFIYKKEGTSEPGGTIYSLDATEKVTKALATNASLDISGYVSITGGSAIVHNGKSAEVNILDGGAIKLGGSSNSYLCLKMDNALQAGDVISVSADGNWKVTTTSSNSSAATLTMPYTVTTTDGLAGKKELYLWKTGVSTDPNSISKVTITRGGAEEPETPPVTPPAEGQIVHGMETTPVQKTSNTDIVGLSYTIPGSYNGGQGNANKAFKLKRADEIPISVNENYTITSFTLTGADNYKSDGITITGVYVDGSSTNLLAQPVVFPASQTANSFTISGISAKSTIKITCASSTDAQLNTTIDFNYDYAVQPIAYTGAKYGNSRNGMMTLSFNNPLDEKMVPVASFGGRNIKGEVSGTEVTFVYSDLAYSTPYTFTLPAGQVKDQYGSIYNEAINVNMTTASRATATRKGFDRIVSTGQEFADAIAAANAANSNASANRFRILCLPGVLTIPASATTKTLEVTLADKVTKKSFTINDPITYLNAHNVSIIGLDYNTTTVTNTVPGTFEGQYGVTNIAEGIGNGDVLQIGTRMMNTYFQDIKISTAMGDGHGRDIAVQDKGDKTIFKNVYLYGYQDTYTNNNANGRVYFEDGVIRGRTDYICGKADIWYEGVTFAQIYGGYAAVPSTPKQYGWVMNNCKIVGEPSSAHTQTNISSSYTLGRPWGQGTPVALWINTRMEVIPKAEGWDEMEGGWPARFAEYNSMDASGNAISLTGRKKTFYSSYANNPVLSADEAAYYSRSRVMGSTDGWDPTEYTIQCAAPTVSLSGNTLTWNDDAYASSWVVLKDGEYYANPVTNSIQLTERGSYTVRAANDMGGLGTASTAVQYGSGVTPVDPPVANSYAELVHTVSVQGGSNAAGTFIDQTTHYYNNWGNTAWVAQAYLIYNVTLPVDEVVSKATLKFRSSCAGDKDGRVVNVYCLNKDDAASFDYTNVQLRSTWGTLVSTETDNRAESDKTVDATSVVKDMVTSGEKTVVVFQLGGAAAGANVYGKGSEQYAPTLEIQTEKIPVFVETSAAEYTYQKNGSTKDMPNAGVSYTIPGTCVAGAGNGSAGLSLDGVKDGGIKMRTKNMRIGSQNGFAVNVNEGYCITAIDISAANNYADKADVTAVYVDGDYEHNVLANTVTFGSDKAVGTLSVSGFRAHDKIEFVVNTTAVGTETGTQLNFFGKVTYHEVSQLNLQPKEAENYLAGTYDYVILNRTLKKGYSSLCLPFNTTVAELTGGDPNAYVAYLSDVEEKNGAYTLIFTNGQTIEANKPYIIYISNEAGIVNPMLENVTVGYKKAESIVCGLWTMSGNYERGKSMYGLYGIANNASIMRGGANSTINAYTSYMECSVQASLTNISLRGLVVDGEDEETSVGGMPVAEELTAESIYTVDGRKLDHMQRGVNVVRWSNGMVTTIFVR